MDITLNTVDAASLDQAIARTTANIKACRENLARDAMGPLAVEGADPTVWPLQHMDLGKSVRRLAEYHGAYVVLMAAKQAFEETQDPTKARDAALQLLLTSPDDTWSGRGNEDKRAYNDGKRTAADAIHSAVRYRIR